MSRNHGGFSLEIKLRRPMHRVPAVSRQLFWIRHRKKTQNFLLFSKRSRVIIPVGNLKVEWP
jgi:hypothetical protein